MTEPFHVRQAREERGRRVVQLSTHSGWLIALCDDGSIWFRDIDQPWQSMPAPPAKDRP